MALRGDSIDNVPGAPGIGDKGSVELIKRFGSVEQALDRAAEVEKKTYRESLQNNRDNILLSKQLVTIDCNVPIELNVDAMRMGQPDLEGLRALFTELEFTSLLKELLPVVEVSEAHYREAASAADVDAVPHAVPAGGALAVAVEADTIEEEETEENEPESGMLLLVPEPRSERPRNIAISAAPGVAVTVVSAAEGATAKVKSVLADPNSPKAIHDYKAASHVFEAQGIALHGVRHDPMLYSYLLDPTYSSHRLADVALRRFNLKLGERSPRQPTSRQIGNGPEPRCGRCRFDEASERSICRWCRCWREWSGLGSKSIVQLWRRCRHAWNSRSRRKLKKSTSVQGVNLISARPNSWEMSSLTN